MKTEVKQILEGDYQENIIFESATGITKTLDKGVPAGVYELISFGGIFNPRPMLSPLGRREEYIDIRSGTIANAMGKANHFFADETKKKYGDLKIGHKTGIILHGRPGTGKTVIAQLLMEKLVQKYDAICIVLGNKWNWSVRDQAIDILSAMGRPLIMFVDECEVTLKQNEAAWLTFLDGYDSIQNFMFIGCTNYIQHIPARMKRPSRIEHIIEVGHIEEDFAKEYVETKLGKLDKHLLSGILHHTMEEAASVDCFKNAVKEFYVNTPANDIETFAEILKDYCDSEKKNLKDEAKYLSEEDY